MSKPTTPRAHYSDALKEPVPEWLHEATERAIADAPIAAHHEDLGLDRSVCLRDVVEWMRARLEPGGTWDHVADAVEREFS